MNPVAQVEKFLEKHLNPALPVLLGLSGGPDSLLLFHVLLAIKGKTPLQMGVAHVDHGWREESGAEAEALKRLVEEHGLPFHLCTLDPQTLKGNLEAACRQKRLGFFGKLCLEHGYQAVLLGHHADDQAETVLKRIFEGANLTALSGLSSVACLDGLVVWRPLLEMRKKGILDWLKKRGLIAFDDKTNLDPKFLRSRMRTSLIPALCGLFGKEIGPPLAKLAKESAELSEFLNSYLHPYLQTIKKNNDTLFLDLSRQKPSTVFELKHLVRAFCAGKGVVLSRQQLETAADLLLANASGKKLMGSGWKLSIDRSHLALEGESTI